MLQIPGFKILVTSRFVFPKFDTYKLKLLSEKDAMNLFCASAFKDGNPNVRLDLVHKVKGYLCYKVLLTNYLVVHTCEMYV